MQSRIRRAPRIYFSFRSPFSWLGVDRLLTLRPSVVEDCAWIPFWDPSPMTDSALRAGGGGFHYTQMSKAKHLYILQDAKRLCEKYGKQMQWPVDRDPTWEVPHLAWLGAPPADRWAVYRSITEMRWETGQDICDPDLLAAHLEGRGLDPALATQHGSDEVRADGVQCLVEAYNDDIFGIPYFKAGAHRFWGLERVDWFIATYDAWRDGRSFAAVVPGLGTGPAGPPLDVDSPGGCG